MAAMASQITSPMIVYLSIYWVADQIKHKSSASLAFLCGGGGGGGVCGGGGGDSPVTGECPAQMASNA